MDSFSNEVTVIFRTDARQDDKTGFILRINASVEGLLRKAHLKKARLRNRSLL